MPSVAQRDLRLGRERDPRTPDQSKDFLLPPHHLVTHGVVLGMTGSGKTGLAVVTVEEALGAGVPVLVVDVKGDLPNLLLSFPDLAPSDYAPWVDAEAATRDGKSVEEIAAGLAKTWRDGLASWKLGSSEIGALKAAVAPRILTPGARIAEPIDVLSGLSRRSTLWDEDEEAAHDQLAAAISLLLRLAGREGDPRSRDHVVLSTFAERRIRAGKAAPLAELLADLLTPPVTKIGAMEFEDFMPPKDRQSLAQDLNTLLASPKLGGWLTGAPLDVGAWLTPKDGKTPLVIVSVAHLDDEERQLVLGLLLDEVLGWVRGLPGTSRLRALVFFDEVFGFLPPHPASPPTKKPLLALLKQARAFGVGVVLATQNPMDLDYKALSNAGAWFVGRLQTDADRERVVEGLTGADGGLGGLEPADLGAILRNLPPRTFFVRDVHRTPACALVETRFTMSWLRGPMTRREIARLAQALAPRDASVEAEAEAAPAALDAPKAAANGATPATSSTAPPPPVGWSTWFGHAGTGRASTPYVPYVAGTVLIRGRDTKLGLSVERRHTLIAPFDPAGRLDLSRAAEIDPASLRGTQVSGASFLELPRTIATKKGADSIEKTLRDHASSRFSIVVDVHRTLGLARADGETQEAFVARCRAEAERRAGLDYADASTKGAPAIAKLEQRVATAQAELVSAQQGAASAPGDLGTAFLRVALGRNASAPLTKAKNKAETRLRKAEEAARKAELALREARAGRDAELAASVERARRDAFVIESVRLVPKRGDIETIAIGIAWGS
jgi:hypothetical protein